MLPEIEFETGLLLHWQPPGPFVMLADPAAVPAAVQARWLSHWRGRCVAWVPQIHTQSSLDAAAALMPAIWPHLARDAGVALWAVGGGTTLDLAKVLRWRLPEPGQGADCWRANQLPEVFHRHALWCSPTTAGTGSEVTPWATVWDLAQGCKRSWHPPQGQPDLALIDPQLSSSCPWSVTRDCGLDALAHALESLWNRRADATSRGLGRQAARRILSELPRLREQPQDLNLRSRMMHASLMAGMAMARTQTALAHALSYDLTLAEGLPHGQACAVWLPMVMEMAAQRSPRVRADLQDVFGQPLEPALAWLSHWLSDLGVQPRDLRTQPQGQLRLEQALASARGANFIAAEP